MIRGCKSVIEIQKCYQQQKPVSLNRLDERHLKYKVMLETLTRLIIIITQKYAKTTFSIMSYHFHYQCVYLLVKNVYCDMLNKPGDVNSLMKSIGLGSFLSNEIDGPGLHLR